MSKERLFQLVETKKDQYTKVSDAIWGYAETRFEEEKSSRALIELLAQEGFAVEEDVGDVPFAFTGTWGQGEPRIGFLGEYDALGALSQKADKAVREAIIPGGNGHGCGHHLLGTASLAAAVALKDYFSENNLTGTIIYYGCPGEEGGSGKTFMAREGVFDGLDAAITWHPGNTTAVASGSSLANIQVYFNYIGRASHAGGSPHLGRSALDAVELMNVGVQYLREHIITEARVHYAVTNTGGKSPNVVQPEAEVLYLIRAPKNEQVKEIFERVIDIAKGAALMTSTQMNYTIDKACSNLIPNEVMEKLMNENLQLLEVRQGSQEELAFAAELQETLTEEEKSATVRSLMAQYGERQGRAMIEEYTKPLLNDKMWPYQTSEKSMSGSTDVSDVSWLAPTVQCSTSCYCLNTPGHSWQMVAQGKKDWAHTGMLKAAKAMAGVALDLFNDPAKIKEAQAELQERVGPKGYECPIPAGIKPSKVR
ncbi:MAG: amidohydrolase [Firmicutes bacterium]|jgi:aminobenzoyl-glutamate utilization protein B|nr:amidohydrolase [Bacillota bacterium]